MVCGVFLLTFALILSTRMGIYQEDLFTTYGKHPKEALFYTHALPLPFFLLLAPDILHHWRLGFDCELLWICCELFLIRRLIDINNHRGEG